MWSGYSATSGETSVEAMSSRTGSSVPFASPWAPSGPRRKCTASASASSREPSSVPNVVDGDAATSWSTSTYQQNFGPAGLKTGVGLVVDLGATKGVRQVVVTIDGGEWLNGAGEFNKLEMLTPDMWDQIEKTMRR